jgi:DNA phosphorothioation-dependent restriction protein DptG
MINKLKEVTVEDIKDKNILTLGNFYPLKSKDKGFKIVFDSKVILGLIIGYISNQKIEKKFEIDEFKRSCQDSLQNKLSDEQAIAVICKIYFDSNVYLNLSPLMYQIYQSENKEDKSNKAFEMIFKPFLKKMSLNIETSKKVNFIEKHIIDSFKKHCKSNENTKEIHGSYLSVLEEVFLKDFNFLLEREEYFLANIDRFIKFYIFIYASQLALNLKPYFLEKPIIRELYFILNSEKTSQERKKLVNGSYKTLFEKVGYLFPYLSMLGQLATLTDNQDLRLYELLDEIENTQESIQVMDEFTRKFREKRKLENIEICSENIEKSIKSLFKSAYQEFFDKANTKDKIFRDYKNAFEKHIAKDFIQGRGRFGKVCVLNQEMILFLTNLAIGDRDSLYFEELIAEFEKRGVFFDHKSKEALLALFERVENIERKSDSGDSIYVYKTV